jgi:hypothetical protein
VKQETLAVRFSSVENAKKWEAAFERARKYVLEQEAARILKEEAGGGCGADAAAADHVAARLEGLAVKEGSLAAAAAGDEA